MDWIEHDQVPVEALPEWARTPTSDPLDGGGYRVFLEPRGIVLGSLDRRVRARFSALTWESILVPIPLSKPQRLLLAVPRRAPAPPWYELHGRHLDAVASAVRTRLDALRVGGYRMSRKGRVTLSPEEVRAAVLARRPLPGEVVIPAAAPAGYPIATAALMGGVLGALAFPLGWVAMAGVSLATAASGAAIAMRWRGAARVLVLTPDAFVGGLDGRAVRAIPWSKVDAFAVGVDAHHQSALVVHGHDAVLARVNARFFGAPLDVIVSVAEAYRVRAQAE